MRRFWKIAGIAAVVAVVAVMALGAVALAQETEDGDSWPFQFREKLHEAIAGVLGITVDEYDSAVDTARDQVLDDAVTEGLLTQDQADLMRERADEGWLEGFGRGMRPGGHGRRGGMMDLDGGLRGFGGTHSTLLTIAAEQLGTTVEDLVTQLGDGNTIAELAEAQGVDTQEIADAYLENLSERLDEAVANERITQERADWMLEQAAERVQERMEAAWPGCLGHPDGMYDGFMPGGRHGFFEDDAEVEGTSG
jgi:uncharacterized protein YidB (DUF937 family)